MIQVFVMALLYIPPMILGSVKLGVSYLNEIAQLLRGHALGMVGKDFLYEFGKTHEI